MESGWTNLFGAEKIPMNNLADVERQSPEIIVWAAPIMMVLVLAEYIISGYQQRKYYDKRETIGSIGVGIGNVAMGLVVKAIMLYFFVAIYNLVPWRMAFSWWTFLPCYVLFDLCSYVAHRVSHTQRFLWATHVPHHSAEHYNLSVSFRLSWVQYIKIFFFFPVAFMGFHPVIVFITNQIAVLFQFWAHTEYIPKLHPVVEYIFATPSNHRVHHGSQPKYINKNYGATFVLWDRMFGSYQEEEEKVIYGLTHNIDHKHNPVHINFHEYVDIIRDVRTARNWKERWFFLFGDPGDVAAYKMKKLEAAAEAEKEQAPKPTEEAVLDR